MAANPNNIYSGSETRNFSNGLPEKKGFATRLYEGLYKIPGLNRIVGKMEIAYNQFRADKHEKKAAEFKGELDANDLEIRALDLAKAQIESNIEKFKQKNIPGVETFQLESKKIDRQKMDILNKKDKKQSKFESRDNKVKLYVNKRDAIADRLIGRYDEKLHPMEQELEGLQTCKDRADLAFAVMDANQDELSIKMQELEQQKTQLEETYRSLGYSDKKIKRNGVVKMLEKQLAQDRKKIRAEKEARAKRKDEIGKKIAKVDAKANPYRDRREKFVRVKEGRPVDMGVKTRERTQVFAGQETIAVRTRKEKDGELDSGIGAPASVETADKIAVGGWFNVTDLVSDWNGYIKGKYDQKVSIDQADFESTTNLRTGKLDKKNFREILRAYYKLKKIQAGVELDSAVDAFFEEMQVTKNVTSPKIPAPSAEAPDPSPKIPMGDVTEERESPIRAAAWHTIRKMEDLKMKYADLNGATEKEREENFLRLTRQLWNEFTVHGITKNGSTDVIRESDLDGESWLKLLELAGFPINRDKVNFIKAGTTRESGIIGDTSKKQSGVIAEDKGKKLTIDHHGPESDRTTSATKFVYEMLIALNLLKKEDYLDKFVDFVTACDNTNFSDNTSTVYENYAKNLYGLRPKIKLDDILQMFKENIDPAQEIPEDRLKNMEYEDLVSGKKKTLEEFSKKFQKKMERGNKAIDEMADADFVMDTGDSRFGRVLVDIGRVIGKSHKWIPRVDSENHSGQLAAFAKGYGAYLKWSPQNNEFVIFTKDKKMDDAMVSGGFGQGFNMRGYMWMKPALDAETHKLEPLTVKLEDILAKLAGQTDFKIEGKLKKALIDGKSKEMLGLLDEGKLTEDVLRKSAGDLKIKLGDFLDSIASQRDNLRKKYAGFKKSNKAGADDLMVKSLTRQPIQQPATPAGQPSGTAGQPAQQPPTPAQQPPSVPPATPPNMPPSPTTPPNVPLVQPSVTPPNTPPAQPPVAPPNIPPQPGSPDKLDAAQLNDEFRKISNDFGVSVNYDSIMGEEKNREIINTLREALGNVDRKKLSGIINSIALSGKRSGMTKGGENILLRYTLLVSEMTQELESLLDKAANSQSEALEKKYGVKSGYGDIFRNAKSQMEAQSVSREAQENFFAILKGVVDDSLDDDQKKKLEGKQIDFRRVSSSDNEDDIKGIILKNGIITVAIGSINISKQDNTKLMVGRVVGILNKL
ncbi:MAG: hypothetical protein WC120_01175 [Parcubacteria group bacterium]